MILMFCALGWLICATIAAGLYLSYVQRRWPNIAEIDYRRDLLFTWGISLLAGPIALVLTLVMAEFGRYGFMNPFVLNKYNT